MEEKDKLHEDAKAHIIRIQRASISNIQRKFMIGYNRAAWIMEHLENEGVVSEFKYDGTRTVLVKPNNSMKTKDGEDIIEVECPNCGDKFIGWPEHKDTLCLDCYAEKELSKS
jgi:protein-arginine kinase activator protein McsA